MNVWVVLCNFPDEASAVNAARVLVEEKLAACVNRLAACESCYEWDGKVVIEQEFPLLIKTSPILYDKLEQRLRALHPYDIPEIIALETVAALPEYRDWVAAVTGRHLSV